MMQHSDDVTRDHLFSAHGAGNVGLAGIGSLIGGGLPALLGGWLHSGAESPLAYRATFGLAGAGLMLSLVPLLLIRPRVAELGGATAGEVRPGLRTHIGQAARALPSKLAALRLGVVRRSRAQELLAHIPEPWRGMLRRPWPIIQLLIPPALISSGAALLVPYLNLFFKERFGIANSTLGAIFAALGLITGLAALGGPLLSARIGKPRAVALTQALSIPFLLLLGFVPVLGIAVGAALARGALFNMAAPLYDALERSDPAARPTIIGLINATYATGYLAAPAISALVQERYGFGPLFGATALCYGLAVTATAWFFVRPAREGGEVREPVRPM
jgi:dipeptide/tripeptide permease